MFGEDEIAAIADVLRGEGPLARGPRREQFEQEFADFVGVRHAFSLTNCAVALELATKLLLLRPGDEVIATPQTYQASILPLLTSSAVVRFADIDRNSLCIDGESIETLITERTRAIYLTHYGGLMADMDAIMALAEQNGLVVIEDCAHALGSEYLGRRAGSTAHIGCFSFESLKNMSTLGEGGMITFGRDEWADAVERLRFMEPWAIFTPAAIRFGDHPPPSRDLNRHAKNAYTHDCVRVLASPTNASLSEAAAAVGSVQLRRLERSNDRRRAIGAMLNAELEKIDGVRVQREPPGYKHVYHLYTFFVDPRAGLSREAVAAAIDDRGVEIHLRYFPLHLLPEWRRRGHGLGECPVAESLWFEEQVNLPCHPMLSDEQVQFMADAVRLAVGATDAAAAGAG